MSDDIKAAAGRKLSFFQTIRAVLWSFVGLRRGKDYHDDMARLNPVHLIIAALLLAGCFVVALVLIVRAVVA